MRLSEELAVDSGSPEVVVMDDNDLIGIVNSYGDCKAKSDIWE